MLLFNRAGATCASRTVSRGLLPFLLLAWAVSACSPTFNWREWRSDGTPLLALMPCKPESAVRPVPLGGAPTTLHTHSCDTGGLTFAVAWAELPDAARAPEALGQWRGAALAAIRLDPALALDVQTQWDARVPGASTAQGLRAQGTTPDNRPVQMRAVYFARGSQIYQAAVYGTGLPDAEVITFFDGLRLP
jgi:propanediol dehydratase small subunit